MVSAGVLDDLPAGPGAYALLLRLTEQVEAPARAFPSAVLAPATYLYAGSAWGPGGIRARVLRHARRGKARHWHVDSLTRVADLMAVFAFPGGHECEVIERGRALPGTSVPLAGFGSSDCRSCAAHLLTVPPDIDLAALIMVRQGISFGVDTALSSSRSVWRTHLPNPPPQGGRG